MGKPITQYCALCRTRKPIKGFNINLGICADCNAARRHQDRAKSRPKSPKSQPASPGTSKCPTCLQRIDVDPSGTELVEHKNSRGATCAGSRHELPQKSRDAFDYRVPGSFEGGGRH